MRVVPIIMGAAIFKRPFSWWANVIKFLAPLVPKGGNALCVVEIALPPCKWDSSGFPCGQIRERPGVLPGFLNICLKRAGKYTGILRLSNALVFCNGKNIAGFF